MPSVVFICTANQHRSPLAAAAFIKKLQEESEADQWAVGSAGTWTKIVRLAVALHQARSNH